MNKTRIAGLVVAAALAVPALAQQKDEGHSGHHPPTAADAAAADATEGEVRRIDKAASKVTLKHGEIRNLDMPAMTMVFAVRDKAVLERLQPGDKVRFKAVNDAGQFTLTEIEVVR